MTRMQTRERARLVAVVFASVVLALAASVFLSWRSEQKWCALITTLDEGYNAPVRSDQPALTERGRRIAEDVHALRDDLGCSR